MNEERKFWKRRKALKGRSGLERVNEKVEENQLVLDGKVSEMKLKKKRKEKTIKVLM